MMEPNYAYPMGHHAGKITVAGSLMMSVTLFALSMMAMIVIGCVLGALVLVERIARQCNDEEREELVRPVASPVRPRALIGGVAYDASR